MINLTKLGRTCIQAAVDVISRIILHRPSTCLGLLDLLAFQHTDPLLMTRTIVNSLQVLQWHCLVCVQVLLEAIPGRCTKKYLDLWSPDSVSVPFTARLSADTPAQFDVAPTSVSPKRSTQTYSKDLTSNALVLLGKSAALVLACQSHATIFKA